MKPMKSNQSYTSIIPALVASLGIPALVASLGVPALVALGACGGAKSEPAEPAPAIAPTTEGEGADDTAADSAAATDDAASADKPALPTALGPNQTPDGVVFNFKPGSAKGRIYLAGNFNDWNPQNNDYLMKDEDGDGVWTIVVKLAPGTYQYKYVADGQWIKDPRSPAAHPDGFGGQNGKFTVK